MNSRLQHLYRKVVPSRVRRWLLPRLTASWFYLTHPHRIYPNLVRQRLVRLRYYYAQHPKALVRRLAVNSVVKVISALLTWVANGALFIAVKYSPYFTERRMARGRVRTLWGVTPILTLPLKARADRELGFDSGSIVYTTYVITSQFDINLRRAYLAAAGLGVVPAFQRLVLAWALCRYDVFHTFADQGLLDSRERLQIDPFELGIWRATGKRLYIYAYGADVRTRSRTLALGRWNFCSDCTEPGKYCICVDAEGEKSVAALTKFATALVSLGDMTAYMPTAKCFNYWPIDLKRIGAPRPINVASRIRIGHAPNHTHFKGSRYLEAIIAKLCDEGHAIEYVKVQGVPNAQVLELFASCDLVADQFIGGAYGYSALEAMALGRPVLSFVRDADQLDAPEECPIINATPDTLERILTWVLQNRDSLPAIGDQGRCYVARWHSIEAVALRLGKLYFETADFPPAVLDKIEHQRLREIERRQAIRQVPGWQHPYRVTSAMGTMSQDTGSEMAR